MSDIDFNTIDEEIKKMEDNETEATVKADVEGLELFSETHPFRLPLRIKNFDDDSAYKKFIKNCERLIRSSQEYKLWRQYIVDVLGINTCTITHERMDEVTIEVHHHVPSLFIVVKAVVNEKIEKELEFSTFDICLEVIKLHFQNKIGYTTLLKSIHEKFHNGFLSVPMDVVRGDYKYFLENYMQYLDEDDIDVINKRLATNSSNVSWARDDYEAVQG